MLRKICTFIVIMVAWIPVVLVIPVIMWRSFDAGDMVSILYYFAFCLFFHYCKPREIALKLLSKTEQLLLWARLRKNK